MKHRAGHWIVTLGITALSLGCAAEAEPEQSDVDKAEYAEQAVNGKADWSLDPCERWGWYGDGDCDWFCPREDSDCALPSLFQPVPGEPTRYPTVLHHGFAGGHDWIFAWTGVAEALSADGHVIVQTEVPPFDSIAVRVARLKQVVDDLLGATGAEKVNIIAHSMGGMDARYLVSTLGYGDRVASITTISTPHRGTHVADFALSIVPGFADPAVNALAEILGSTFSDEAEDSHVRAALIDLSEDNADAFNAANPDDERVFYQSWAGVSSVLALGRHGRDPELLEVCEDKLFLHDGTFDRLRPIFVALSPVVGKTGANGDWHDGLVAVGSAKWGTFHGCIPADHSEEVGQFTSGPPNPKTGFDHIAFYRTLVWDLSARGY